MVQVYCFNTTNSVFKIAFETSVWFSYHAKHLACLSSYAFSQVVKYQSVLCFVCSHFIWRPQLQRCSY